VSDSTIARIAPSEPGHTRKGLFTAWSHIVLKDLASNVDTGDMADRRERTSTSTASTTCDEVRSTRLHYRLRCLLVPGHDGDHQWTPELVPADLDGDEAATG
jgi:hypothetical protein